MPRCVTWGRLGGYRVSAEWGSVSVKGWSEVWPGSGEQPGDTLPSLKGQLQLQWQLQTDLLLGQRQQHVACMGTKTMRARRDQLWQGMCWQGFAPINSGSLFTSMVGSTGKKMHFLGAQFQQKKMLPERDFDAGRFSVAGVWKEMTPRTSHEAQVPGNCSSIVIRAILLIRPPGTH